MNASSKKSRNKAETRAEASLRWTDHAWDDYLWHQQHNAVAVAAINALIQECLRSPFKGTGKPEPLCGDLSGFWSRRIDRTHRLVYLYEQDALTIVQCRYHYGDR
ncbi:addiction module toxin Txe [Sphaerotilus natans subsp. natans DSM 6575]|uniref:Putative mRNA interferase YoeB n=1 Tax=Sphaerotilus natans subsp. natans DSM 6575 TaxID=1286631 RepID=A0A059KGK0_9BURK|nr:Txe/YoeB family addiction module toxin [Sphaerotilus natans]KDB50238.1 addiction module toxin Txe [Sphaerotilus natans subsp. natans DSM 6575]SIR81802.1 toxin YoeB [Sphaerotilus natans]